MTPVFTDIRRNVGFFTGRGGTVGYLIDAKGVAIVDSQFPDSATLLLAGVNERSNSRPVDRLINTFIITATGASLKGWIAVIESTAKDPSNDTNLHLRSRRRQMRRSRAVAPTS